MGALSPILAAGRFARRERMGRARAIAALTLLERLALAAAAYAFLVGKQPTGQIVVGVAAALMMIRGVAQRIVVARNEARLYLRVTEAAVYGNVLQESILPDEDARSGLFEGLHRVAALLGQGVPNLVGNLIAALVLAVFIAFSLPASVTVVGAAALLAGGLALAATRGWVARAQDVKWVAWGAMANWVSDAYEGRVDIVATGQEDDFIRRFRLVVDDWATKSQRAGWAAGATGRAPALALVVAVGIAAAIYSRWHGLPASEVALDAAILASCVPAFLGVGQGLQELATSASRLRLVERILASRKEPSLGVARPAPSPDVLECSGVAFTHTPGSARALRTVSFIARRGEVVVLAGPNGSGKSSVLKAMLGLGSLEEGTVACDGVSLSALDSMKWRQSITFLPQRPYLPSRATIRDAIRFVDPGLSDPAIAEALDRVGLLSILRTRGADPLDIRIGALSAGERQRVALARTLCRRTSVLLLDEPDANLDRDGIRLVAHLAVELAPSRVVVIAAHAPEILEVGDTLVRLEAGEVRSIERKRSRAVLAG